MTQLCHAYVRSVVGNIDFNRRLRMNKPFNQKSRNSVLYISADGLDAETLNALGNVEDLADVADAVTSPDSAVIVSIVR